MKLCIIASLLLICGCASVPRDVLHDARVESETVLHARYRSVSPARVILPSSAGSIAVWLNDVPFGDPADVDSAYGCSKRDIAWYHQTAMRRMDVTLAEIEHLDSDLLLQRIADVIDEGKFAVQGASPGLSIIRKEYMLDTGNGYDAGRAYYLDGQMVFRVVDYWMRQ